MSAVFSMIHTCSNEEWLHDLKETGEAQEQAIANLQNILLRAALYLFNRNAGDLTGLASDEVPKLAENCAQEALIAILNHLSDFRGDRKFTTKAYKFAVNMCSHLDLTLEEASARLNADRSGNVVAYGKVHDEILEMSHMLTEGIIAQFRNQFT